jgi:hypothetical protein
MAKWALDDAVLDAYIKTFYGHTGYGAKYWFVGMEFGGGGSAAEIVRRIQGWQDRGRPELEDIVGPPGQEGSRWFRPPYPLQPTWAKLIRVALSAEGPAPTTEQVRAYQKERLGRAGGLDCLLELLPLPSPGSNQFRFYPEYSELPYLRDRATYTSHVAPARISHLRRRIAEHRPAAVIFYGSGYAGWWRQIAGTEFRPAPMGKVAVASNGQTEFVIMQHPTAFGLRSAYFDAVGRLIAGAPDF